MTMLSRLLPARVHACHMVLTLRGAAPGRRTAAIERLEDRTMLSRYEVWAIDQSNTSPDGGGTLYIYEGHELAGASAARAEPEVIDLGDLSPGVRPHMIFFNEAQSHAIVSFVATGHVLFIDAASRTPVGVIDVGDQAHAAFPSPDESYVIVADQNGKKLHRIQTDYATNTFTLEATLDLTAGTTPSGALLEDPALRPDNAPICTTIDATSQFTFVTLRGGGLFVVDTAADEMAIVAEYDNETVHPNGCGGVEANGKMYITSGGGTPANPVESDLYAFPLSGFSTTPNPPNTPAPTVVFSHDDRGFADAHGVTLTKHGRYVWVADRAANLITVVDTSTDLVVNEFTLVGQASDDPAPDLLAMSPSGNRAFAALRGPNPLSANVPGVNNAVGSTPGVGVIHVQQGGRSGVLKAVAPISHVVDGVERADPHGIAVRVITNQGDAAVAGAALRNTSSPSGDNGAAEFAAAAFAGMGRTSRAFPEAIASGHRGHELQWLTPQTVSARAATALASIDASRPTPADPAKESVFLSHALEHELILGDLLDVLAGSLAGAAN